MAQAVEIMPSRYVYWADWMRHYISGDSFFNTSIIISHLFSAGDAI